MEENERRIAELHEIVDKITATKDSSISFLKNAGILDNKGQLSPMYR